MGLCVLGGCPSLYYAMKYIGGITVSPTSWLYICMCNMRASEDKKVLRVSRIMAEAVGDARFFIA